MMGVGEILQAKGRDVYTVFAHITLREAARRMFDFSIGALVCVDGSGSIIGVLSERDIARAVALRGHDAIESPVGQAMSRDVIACSTDDTIDSLLSIMSETHCHHLPVVRQGAIVGLVSVSDLIKAEHHL